MGEFCWLVWVLTEQTSTGKSRTAGEQNGENKDTFVCVATVAPTATSLVGAADSAVFWNLLATQLYKFSLCPRKETNETQVVGLGEFLWSEWWCYLLASRLVGLCLYTSFVRFSLPLPCL